MIETFYLVRHLDRRVGTFEIVDTVATRAEVDDYNLTAVAGDVQWHNSYETFGPATHKWTPEQGFSPLETVREPKAIDILDMLVKKGVITRADVAAVDEMVAKRLDLRK